MIEIDIRMNVQGRGERYYDLGKIELVNTCDNPKQPKLRNYEARFYTKKGQKFKTFRIEDHPSERVSIWQLIKKVFVNYE